MMEHEGVEQLLGPSGQTRRDRIHKSFQRFCHDVRVRLEKYLQEYKICENVDEAVKYFISRPLLLVGVIAVTFAIGLPILFFTLFAVTTIACTFAGFVLVEGTILAFGTVVLCGLLLSIITSIMVLAMCLASAYYIFLRTCAVIKKF